MKCICSECLRCACWLGIFMCYESRNASLYRARKADLLKLGLEHEDWMNQEGAQAPRSDRLTPMLPRKLFKEYLAR